MSAGEVASMANCQQLKLLPQDLAAVRLRTMRRQTSHALPMDSSRKRAAALTRST